MHAQGLSRLLVARSGDDRRTAVVHEGGRTTYARLEQRAHRLGAALEGLGVGAGDSVGLLATNRIEWLETFFGTAYVGATTHAFSTWATREELEALLGESCCSILVLLAKHGRRDYLKDLEALVPEAWNADAGRWLSARFPGLKSIVVIGDAAPRGALEFERWLSGPTAQCPARVPSAPPDSHPAVVLYTSGSTARPKAVPLESHVLMDNGFNIGERMGLRAGDLVWLGSPLFWAYGCANAVMATFTHRAALVVQEQFEASAAIELIEAEKCTAAYLLPTLAKSLIASPHFTPARVSTLRTGLMIGTVDDLRLVAEGLGVDEICNVYGATEVYGNCCVTPHDLPLIDRLSSQGPPLPGVEVRVIEIGGTAPCPTGQDGEIQVRGHVTSGYLGVDMVTAGILTEDGFYRTGDLGHLDERGFLYFKARASDLIKTAGINVSPAEVEDFLSSLCGVSEVAVVGAPDARRDEVVVAFVVPKEGSRLDGAELIERCRGRIASYKIPVRIVVVHDLPKTDTGKLQRSSLKAMATELAERDVRP